MSSALIRERERVSEEEVALPSVLIWRRRSHFLSELVVGVEDDGEDVPHLPPERGLQEPGGDQVEDEEGGTSS